MDAILSSINELFDNTMKNCEDLIRVIGEQDSFKDNAAFILVDLCFILSKVGEIYSGISVAIVKAQQSKQEIHNTHKNVRNLLLTHTTEFEDIKEKCSLLKEIIAKCNNDKIVKLLEVRLDTLIAQIDALQAAVVINMTLPFKKRFSPLTMTTQTCNKRFFDNPSTSQEENELEQPVCALTVKNRTAGNR